MHSVIAHDLPLSISGTVPRDTDVAKLPVQEEEVLSGPELGMLRGDSCERVLPEALI